jgi:CspA family cold shock protein
LNARQKRLFEDSLKKNPGLKMPTPSARQSELTEDDLALLKQGVGDKTSRPSSQGSVSTGDGGEITAEQLGSIVTYFEEKGFGFLRPEAGGRDVFFHISRLTEGQASDLTPGAKVIYELGMDRTGKMAASGVRVAPPAGAVPVVAAPTVAIPDVAIPDAATPDVATSDAATPTAEEEPPVGIPAG